MLTFHGSASHYCVHTASHTFIGTITKYLGLWSFNPRTPFGYSAVYKPSPGELREIHEFVARLSG